MNEDQFNPEYRPENQSEFSKLIEENKEMKVKLGVLEARYTMLVESINTLAKSMLDLGQGVERIHTRLAEDSAMNNRLFEEICSINEYLKNKKGK